jgi:hypothetical protein
VRSYPTSGDATIAGQALSQLCGERTKGDGLDGELSGRRVALACEGGGSHTAFTAGVLMRLLRAPVEIVALSGTSGGAVCATLAWRGLVAGDRDEAVRRLEAFWADNASEGLEALWERWVTLGARLVGEVVSPELSPYSYSAAACEVSGEEGSGDHADGGVGRKEACVVKRLMLEFRGGIEPHERHERRGHCGVESEVV